MFAEILREDAYVAYRVRLEALLKIPTDASDRDIHELIEAGFSADNVKALCDFGRMSPLERDQIIPPKALKTKLARGQRLTVDESDRLFRVAHIIAMAQTLFGDDEKAKHWLSKALCRYDRPGGEAGQRQVTYRRKPVAYLAGTPSGPCWRFSYTLRLTRRLPPEPSSCSRSIYLTQYETPDNAPQ